MTATFLFWGYFGLVLSYLFQLFKYYPKIKRTGGFSFGYYLKDNAPRILIGLLIIPLGVKFSHELLNINLTEWTAFLSGFFSDRTVDILKNRKK